MSKPRGLKVYVWDDYMTDWTPGLAVAIATNVRDARKAVAEARGYTSRYMDNELAKPSRVIPITEDMAPVGWQVAGGG